MATVANTHSKSASPRPVSPTNSHCAGILLHHGMRTHSSMPIICSGALSLYRHECMASSNATGVHTTKIMRCDGEVRHADIWVQNRHPNWARQQGSKVGQEKQSHARADAPQAADWRLKPVRESGRTAPNLKAPKRLKRHPRGLLTLSQAGPMTPKFPFRISGFSGRCSATRRGPEQ